MKLIVSNAFSLNMLPESFNGHVTISTVDDIKSVVDIVKTFSRTGDCINAIGHKSIDDIVRGELLKDGCALQEGSRVTVELDFKTLLLVAQYKGERLPEGATELPEGATIVWMLVALDKK